MDATGGHHDEAERLRARQAEADADATALPGTTGRGAACCVAKVVTASGPSGVGFFKLEVHTVTGAEVEGGAGTLTGTGAHVLAANLGGTVPAVGTAVILTHVDYRWTFRFG